MATITYHNGFTAESSRDADYYFPNGRQVIEIWTNPVSFDTHKDRRHYLQGEHQEHCLSVELDVIAGVNAWVFFYDDQPANIDPVNIIPNDTELVSLLENYG